MNEATASVTHNIAKQPGILHVRAGSADWMPTEEDLSNLVALFQQADRDPEGAIVATRSDVHAEYIGGLDGVVLATSPNIAPGEILLHDFMEPYGLTVEDLAARTFIATEVIAKVVAGERPITATVATCLSRLFGTTSRFWMNLEAEYSLARTLRENGHHFDQIEKMELGNG